MDEKLKNKLKEFALAIKESKEYNDFLESEKSLQNDENSIALLEEFQKKQKSFSITGDQDILQELADIQQKIRNDKNIKKFEQAQEDILNALKSTDELISDMLGTKFAQKTGGGGCCGK